MLFYEFIFYQYPAGTRSVKGYTGIFLIIPNAITRINTAYNIFGFIFSSTWFPPVSTQSINRATIYIPRNGSNVTYIGLYRNAV